MKKKTGRPKGSGAIVLTDEQVETAGKLAGIGCNLDQIAHIIGIHPATLDKIVERDERVSSAISKKRGEASAGVMSTAYKMAASGKCPALTIFWLKTRLRWSEPRASEDLTEDEKEKEFKLNYKV